jgi:hypothetical protein
MLQIPTTLLMTKALTLRSFSNFGSPTVRDPQNLDAALRHIGELLALPHRKTALGRAYQFEEIDQAMAAIGHGEGSGLSVSWVCHGVSLCWFVYCLRHRAPALLASARGRRPSAGKKGVGRLRGGQKSSIPSPGLRPRSARIDNRAAMLQVWPCVCCRTGCSGLVANELRGTDDVTAKTAHRVAGYARRRRSGKAARSSLLAMACLRVLALAFAAQFSGIVHTTLDVAASLGMTDHPDDGCDGDAQHHDCPPGCPSCHCSHGALAWSPPNGELREIVAHPPLTAAGFVPDDGVPPRGAEVTPPDRPPRIA